VICFGLLIPFGEGLNSAQWITLYAAKFGSGVATNAWINYNIDTGNNPTGLENTSLTAKPSAPDTTGLIKSLLLMRSCKNIHDWGVNQEYGGAHAIGAYIVNGYQSRPLYTVNVNGNPVTTNEFMPTPDDYNATPSGVANGQAGDTFIDILTFSGMGDIHLVLGEKDIGNPTKYDRYPGGVLPVCGDVTIPVTGRTGEGIFAAEGNLFAVLNILFDVNRPGITPSDFEKNLTLAATREYNRTSSLMKNFLLRTRSGANAGTTNPNCFWDLDNDGYETLGADTGDYLGECSGSVPSLYWKSLIENFYSFAFDTSGEAAYDFLAGTNLAANGGNYEIGATAWNAVGVDNPFLISTGILEYGWGGAGLWYNKISERNGSLYSAVTTFPTINKYPMVMEDIKAARKSTDTKLGSDFCESYNPRKSGTSSVHLPGEKNQFLAEEAMALYGLCTQLIGNEGIAIDDVSKTSKGANVVEATIQSLFPEFKAFDINSIENREVTPMAQLSAVGRMMLDRAILGVVAAAASSAAGGMAFISAAGGGDAAAAGFGEVAGMTADIIITFTIITLVFGILLHYILPFMPFVYFFFAVGRWVKAVFEAMVGVPLWALAHMRTGGQGLPGDAASGGYFLLLEIFIRPVLVVFSLVAAFAVFSGMAAGLNGLFSLVSTNLFGVAPTGDVNVIAFARGTLDQFFLSALYIILTYMIGTSAFKLIDILPDNILRWAGAGVQSIGSTVDTSDDLIAEWEWQLPYRVQSVASEATSLIKEGLYDPGQKVYEAAKTEAAKTAVKEEKEAAQAKQQMERERAEAAQAVNTPQAQKEAREAREAQEKYLRERQEADAAKERAEKGFGIKKEAIQSAATPKDTKSGGGLGGLLKGFFSGGNK
jgi:hypothetical protein